MDTNGYNSTFGLEELEGKVWGPPGAQAVELQVDFGSGRDLTARELEPLDGACLGFSHFSLSAPPPLALSFSLSLSLFLSQNT